MLGSLGSCKHSASRASRACGIRPPIRGIRTQGQAAAIAALPLPAEHERKVDPAPSHLFLGSSPLLRQRGKQALCCICKWPIAYFIPRAPLQMCMCVLDVEPGKVCANLPLLSSSISRPQPRASLSSCLNYSPCLSSEYTASLMKAANGMLGTSWIFQVSTISSSE